MAKTRKAKKDREVICADALKWLEQQKGLDCIVTSIPEMEEVKLKEDAYRLFMAEAVRKALRATKDTVENCCWPSILSISLRSIRLE